MHRKEVLADLSRVVRRATPGALAPSGVAGALRIERFLRHSNLESTCKPTLRRTCELLVGLRDVTVRYDHDHAALAVLLGLNGLRVSEAGATDVEDLGFDRGHRTLHIIGKGNKPAVIPLVPRVARTIDLAIGERSEGPILHRHDGARLDRRTEHRWVRSIGKRPGPGAVHPHMLRAAFIMAALDAGVPPP